MRIGCLHKSQNYQRVSWHHANPKPASLVIAIKSFFLSSSLDAYLGKCSWLAHVCAWGKLLTSSASSTTTLKGGWSAEKPAEGSREEPVAKWSNTARSWGVKPLTTSQNQRCARELPENFVCLSQLFTSSSSNPAISTTTSRKLTWAAWKSSGGIMSQMPSRMTRICSRMLPVKYSSQRSAMYSCLLSSVTAFDRPPSQSSFACRKGVSIDMK
mmetsp:Transcript_70141/g.195126  ORF Transcript_70141/g.195126 Transcript_70141/m.195126 type:complete len:213 (-) Transcript_70141:1564-2202(-)